MARHRAEHESTASDVEAAGVGPDDTTDEPDLDAADTDTDTDAPALDGPEAESVEEEPEATTPERTSQADTFWADVKVEPIEVALPAGVGYTLRAYVAPADLAEVDGDEPDVEEDADEPAARVVPVATPAADRDDEETDLDSDSDSDELDPDAEADEDAADEDDEPDEEPANAEPDEVPVFLSRRGKLLLFHTPEGLVDFVRSDEPHALRGVATYETLAARIEPGWVAPTEEDRYELDLLVGNLRGGHDTWEPELIIGAGELARDLGYALGLSSLLTSLGAGSPLDDLDDAVRGVQDGGLGKFRARRRMRKIGAQQAALAWRTIIGKISAAVDWRE